MSDTEDLTIYLRGCQPPEGVAPDTAEHAAWVTKLTNALAPIPVHWWGRYLPKVDLNLHHIYDQLVTLGPAGGVREELWGYLLRWCKQEGVSVVLRAAIEIPAPSLGPLVEAVTQAYSASQEESA